MNILIVNGSPKKKGSASAYFGKVLKCLLTGCTINTFSLKQKSSYSKIVEQMAWCDVMIITAPLYYDGLPAHVLPFLREAEGFCEVHPCQCKVYALSNGGFIEGIQNKLHLQMYENWCERTKLSWGGGIGIGGGVMLHVLSRVAVILGILFLVNVVGCLLSSNITGIATAIQSLANGLGVIIFLNSGLIISILQLAKAIRQKQTIENKYTRVMLPSFIFLIITDLFMLLSALLKGKMIGSLYAKRNE